MQASGPSRVLRAALQPGKDLNWPSTLKLPRSAFPARASPEQLQKYRQRCADDLYAWQRANRPERNSFVLHDGPPYANGAVHVGHALNKVLKDLVLRSELARGRRVHYRPGWDCHGLPIELKALQQARTPTDGARALKDAPRKEANAAAGVGLSASEIRRRARELATETVKVQKASFREWGVMGCWDEPYKTMDQGFEVKQLGVFKEMVKKGLISRHHRPVYWSSSSRTALAEAELEYDDHHQCTAAFVKMPFVTLPEVLVATGLLQPARVFALIWTTTPWTLPANQAIAVHEYINYSLLELDRLTGSCSLDSDESTEHLLVATDRIDHVVKYLPTTMRVKAIRGGISGSQLAGKKAACLNPFQHSHSPILTAGFVTASSGTGLVHMAPGHGMEDYQVCQANGIGPILAPVDDEGRYTAEVVSEGSAELRSALMGLDVQSDGAKAVLDVLREPGTHFSRLPSHTNPSLLLASHHFVHKNPIDWRTKQPVIVRATAQWFADASALQQPALSALEDVVFIPENGKTRLSAFLSGRSQWCISRQRAWGVPIPALYHKETGEACITEESIEHIIAVLEERGTDAWFDGPEDDPAWLYPALEPGKWVRGRDTMDVWFDSGTTWTTLEPRMDGRNVADVYIEGTDQHRGWFQSSLLTHVAVQDVSESHNAKAPYAKLITHGFTLDAEGRKMSKSIGNVIAPEQIINGSLLPPIKPRKQKGGSKHEVSDASTEQPKYDSLGPDVLRLWVASSDYTRDVTIAVPLLQDVQNTLQKYRVTVKWLLGVLADYKPSTRKDENDLKLTFSDKASLYRLSKASAAAYTAYGEYAFHKATKEISNFVNNDLSAFYFEICKDTLYTGSAAERQKTQAVLVIVLRELLRMLAAPTPHLVVEVWEHMPLYLKETEEHPLRRIWNAPYQPRFLTDEAATELERAVQDFERLSGAVKLAQEEARRAGKVKSGLACEVQIIMPADKHHPLGHRVREWHQNGELADLLVVSKAHVLEHGTKADVVAAWRFSQAVHAGSDGRDDSVTVVVVPPEGKKCVRCWKYTAEEEGVACERCQKVLQE
ncbi:hypothetical protein BAUCODRAFT_111512 [Baudoinia panamericana UAMH 10762]|uniref:isoleucine--tRNA ligase n=1 Tax=Baudoinia panamericana (strain UAMH 10762) TaxID=717646 RepID=M2LK02_BAUPA|nr:uncharacterized protein BAUCODRAFT_111512 [Baudoinia panamericana UAMH 10762]EMC94547.1 hypothetical protein BAUCODRAFT_111512 [Baudoinia panamericana UAMH 10762]